MNCTTGFPVFSDLALNSLSVRNVLTTNKLVACDLTIRSINGVLSDEIGVSSMTSTGNGEAVIAPDSEYPSFLVKSLAADTGIGLSSTDSVILVSNTDPASAVTMSSAGGTHTIVTDGTGPDLTTKGISIGTGLSAVSTATDITLSNTSPASSVLLGSAGGTESLVVDGSGPVLSIKGLSAGSGITLTPSGDDITVATTGVETDIQVDSDLNEQPVFPDAATWVTIPNISLTASNSGTMRYNIDFNSYVGVAVDPGVPVGYNSQLAINGTRVAGDVTQKTTSVNFGENSPVINNYQISLNNGDIVTVQMRVYLSNAGAYPFTGGTTGNVLRIFGVQ